MSEHLACPSHCCPVHGCKYSYDDCPVFLGTAAPKYPHNNGCEECEECGIIAPVSETPASGSTPRTDAVQSLANTTLRHTREADMTLHARTLERENADLRHDIARHIAIASAEANARIEAERQLKNEQGQSASYLANWKATEAGYLDLDKRRIEAERQRDEAQSEIERLKQGVMKWLT